MSVTTKHRRAILLSLAAFSLWACSDVFNKLSTEFVIPKYELLLMTGLSGLVVIYLVVVIQGSAERLKPKKLGRLLAFGTLHPFNCLLALIGVSHLPLPNFYTISFLTPISVALLAAFFFREHLTWQKILAIASGFLGVIIAVNPAHLFNLEASFLSTLATFGSMAVFTTQSLLMRHLGREEAYECIAFYPRVMMVVVGGIFIAIFGYVPLPLPVIFYISLSGMLGSAGWILIAAAYKSAPSATVAPFHYSQIITGALFGYLIWHDIPTMPVILGACIIILSGLYIVFHTQPTHIVEEPA